MHREVNLMKCWMTAEEGERILKRLGKYCSANVRSENLWNKIGFLHACHWSNGVFDPCARSDPQCCRKERGKGKGRACIICLQGMPMLSLRLASTQLQLPKKQCRWVSLRWPPGGQSGSQEGRNTLIERLGTAHPGMKAPLWLFLLFPLSASWSPKTTGPFCNPSFPLRSADHLVFETTWE